MALTLDKLAKAKGFDPAILARYGVRNGQGGVVIPYHDRQGNEYIKFRIRREPKGGKGEWSWSIGDAPLIPYGLSRPVPYAQGFAWIVEGESDCWALWSHDIPALGMPGASTAGQLHGSHLEGLKTVAIVQEPGEAGERFPTRVANRLWDLGFTGKVYAVVLSAKDPRELLAAHPEDFREALAGEYRAHRTELSKPKAAPAQRSFFVEMSLEEAFASDENVDHLVEGLIPKAGSMVVGAKKKVGKSVLLVNLAKAVARGQTFLGRRCRRGPVVYVSLDEPKQITLDRMEAIGLRDEANIHLVYARNAPTDWPTHLRAVCERKRPVLLIIDTLAKLARIKDINAYGEWNAAFAPLYSIADDFGCAFVVTAHNKKDGNSNSDSIAGSTAVGGGVDTILIMSRTADNTRTIMSEQRYGEDIERTLIAMDRNTFELSIGAELWIRNRREIEQEIISRLGSGTLTKAEVIAAVPRRAADVKSALAAAVDAGWITREGTGSRGDPWKYRVRGDGVIPGPRNAILPTGIDPKVGPENRSILKGPPGPSIFPDDQEWVVQVGPDSSDLAGNGSDPPGLAGLSGTYRDPGEREEDLLEYYEGKGVCES